MSNKYLPHLIVIPEDDANESLVNGFMKHPQVDQRRIQVDRVAGGWREVLSQFKRDHIIPLDQFHQRRVVLLLDFDQQEDRSALIRQEIPERVKNRVFLLGVWTEPERLKANLKQSLEAIGESLAKACLEEQNGDWSHPLLNHNSDELERLRQEVRPFLFRHA